MERNEREEIFANVAELLALIVEENKIDIEDIGAVIFSSTPDINAAFPAAGARAMGWSEVPLFGTLEIDNPEGVARCIRVLILWNTEVPQKEIKHLYLKGASVLRQDLKN
ncbi:chorismate mutase [Propionispora vibrioides]|uniref:chorismate mutase n=1 Tax=Propionispora vibrioides TaxID=112903 RepID=A0A1H8SF81_9FIRM|nr:chorismate mutase [Propionispora vibrioides]